MSTALDRFIGGTYGRQRFQRAYHWMHTLALTGLNYGYADPTLNGEYYLLDRIARTWNRSPMIFDVGAFHGDWTMAVLTRAPSATVHAFEPTPSSLATLSANLTGLAAVHGVALGNKPGHAKIYAPQESPDWTSLYRRNLTQFGTSPDELGVVPVQTLDDFCEAEGIDNIDLLKIDTEGHELSVLEGGQRLLSAGTISAIQFEFGGASIDARVFLRDIIDRLGPQYKVSRLLRDGLDRVHLDERAEIFTYANFVAMRV